LNVSGLFVVEFVRELLLDALSCIRSNFFIYLCVTAAFFYQWQRTCACIIITLSAVVTVIISGLCYVGPFVMIMAENTYVFTKWWN
jgi:hypothetical protein